MARSQIPQHYGMVLLAFLGWALAYPADLRAQSIPDAVTRATKEMGLLAGEPVEVTRAPVTGLATFIKTRPGRPIPVPDSSLTGPEDRALAFIGSHGMAFGLQDASRVRVTHTRAADETGMDHVRLQQLYSGVPVTGGELTVHLRGSHVVSVNGKTLAETEKINTVPTVTAERALSFAQIVLAKHLGVTGATLSPPRLEVLNRGILEGRQNRTRLAWFIEATKRGLREFIWIDAHTGNLLLRFSQLADALSRGIYDAASSSALPGTLIRNEGGAVTGDPDADNAYNFSGDTYTYFISQHDRDSYDDAGAPLLSTVHYCPTPGSCPYGNAFWNGVQMVYGEGFSSADDVVAHELTHAVTEHSANLFYYMQSGALNESYSDIFGETVDLTNGRGTDTQAARWLMGEDLPGIGAVRNMMNPTALGDPGKMSDTQFACAAPGGDAGGVHTNSGVPNHAYALMVDGGSYNGFMVSGIGLTKAGKIQYRALTHYLLSASDFLDNYNALHQACIDLIGTAGITAGDCTEVGKALDAVEMSGPWPCTPQQAATPAFCPIGQAVTNLFFDDLENRASGKWTTNTLSGVNHWTGGVGNFGLYWTGFAMSGIYSFWGFDDVDAGDSTVEMRQNVAIPVSGARMQFNHSYGFENSGATAYDGGVLEYSTDDGVTWFDAGALISAGATYGGTINSNFGNPLGGRSAFVRDSFGYTASQLNLMGLVGQNVRFRFRIGTDTSVDDYGWFIDDIRIYTCDGPPAPRLINISTRGRVETGNNVMIGGFVIGGATPKTVLVWAVGPSMSAVGVPGALANPVLQLFSGQTAIAENDDWQVALPLCAASGYTCGTASAIAATGLAPTHPSESALLITLPPGAYTAIVSGAGGTTGVGLVAVFEVQEDAARLINISTRGRVETGNNVMIGGFVIGGATPKTVLVWAVGPSMSAVGVPGALANPVLQLFSGQTAIAENDDWQVALPLCAASGYTCGTASAIAATGLAPTHPSESALLITLPPGAYTAIVSGAGGTTGVGLVAVFEVATP
jgi:bacillolysin